MTVSAHFEPSGSVIIASGNISSNNTGTVSFKSGTASDRSRMGGNITLETSTIKSKSGGSSRFAQTVGIVLESGGIPRGKSGSMLFAIGSSGNGASGEFNVMT